MLARWVLKVSKESKVKLAPPAQRARPARRVPKATSARWACKARKESKVKPVLPAR